jgi:hypothetical protein
MLGHISKELSSSKPASASVEAARAVSERLRARSSPLRGLLWAEWFAHSKLLLFFLALWLIGVWGSPLFISPGWILLLGGLYALLAGPAYGGGDVLEGCEEFSFALPASRSARYWARVTVGGGTLLLLTAMNFIALGFDLPQILARFYVGTGIIKPLPILKPGLLYGLVGALPFAVFAFSFALAANTHSRTLVMTAWFWAGLAALLLVQLGFWYEQHLWESLTGFFSFPLLVVAGAGVLWLGQRIYSRKEIGSPAAPFIIPARFWLWLIGFILGVCVALALLSSLAKHYPEFFAVPAR